MAANRRAARLSRRRSSRLLSRGKTSSAIESGLRGSQRGLVQVEARGSKGISVFDRFQSLSKRLAACLRRVSAKPQIGACTTD